MAGLYRKAGLGANAGLTPLGLKRKSPAGGLADAAVTMGGQLLQSGTTTPPVTGGKLFRSDVAFTTPIPSSPVLDANAAAISSYIVAAPSGQKTATIDQYNSVIVQADESTRRFSVGDPANPLTIRFNSFGPATSYRSRAIYKTFPAFYMAGTRQHQFIISTAGTTAASAPSFASATSYGQTVADGSAVWMHVGSFDYGSSSGISYGDNRLNGISVPVPNTATPSPGTDGWIVVLDSATDTAYGLWVSALTRSAGDFSQITSVTCSFGSVDPLSGDGRSANIFFSSSNPWENGGKISRGSGAGINVAWGDATWAELSAAVAADQAGDYANAIIPHALHFSTNIPMGPSDSASAYRFPATGTDGYLTSGTVIQEGTRFQLQQSDASINAISNVFDRVMGRTAKVLGAYCTDKGDAAVTIGVEYAWNDAQKAVRAQLGLSGYHALAWDWSTFKPLAKWDGT